jgi:tetratricopeptide (TPR) repeat protein
MLNPICNRMSLVNAMRSFLPHIGRALFVAFLACVAAVSEQAQQVSSALREADTDYRAALAALRGNDLETAEQKLESVVRLAPQLEAGHSVLGQVLVREGKLAPAISELKKAVAITPSDDGAQLALAMTYAQAGQDANALPLFSKLDADAVARKMPLSPQVRMVFVRVLAHTGQIDAAIRQMKVLAPAESGDAEFHDALGSLYAQKRVWPVAEQEFERAIQLNPESASAHLHLGFVLQAEMKGDPAAEWVRASSLAPHDASIALEAGKALADAGLDSQAEPILKHAVQLSPDSSPAALALAIVLQNTNQIPASVDLLRHVVQRDPRNRMALVDLGLALSQMHRAQDGIPYLQHALALEPNNPTAHQDLAAAYLQVDQVESAITELQAALKLAPNSAKIHYDLGVAYKLRDDAANAIPQLEAAEKIEPDSYQAPYVLGLLYMQVARNDEAAQQLALSLKLHPQNGDGWSSLGSVYLRLNRLPEAEHALRQAIQQLPAQADPHLILATVLIKQGKTEEAVEERKIAAGLMRAHMNLQRAEVATNSGKSLLSDGKVDEAIVEFRNAISFDPTFAEAHAELATALDEQGKSAEARKERDAALSLQKTSEPASEPAAKGR